MSAQPRPAPLYRPGMLRECWEYRGFIAASVRREFVARYLGANLGVLWAVAQPLAMILVYAAVFTEIMRPALPGNPGRFAYGIHVGAGMLVWQLFSDVLGRSVNVFVQNAGLLKKVNVPKLALPLIVALGSLSNFAIFLCLFLVFVALAGSFPGWPVLSLLVVVPLVVAFALGLGIALGTVNVFYRDVAQTVAFALQFWFWLTPIVYPASALPAALADVLQWNPLWPIVGFTTALFLDGDTPRLAMLAWPAAVAAALLLLAWVAFRRLSGEIVDEL